MPFAENKNVSFVCKCEKCSHEFTSTKVFEEDRLDVYDINEAARSVSCPACGNKADDAIEIQHVQLGTGGIENKGLNAEHEEGGELAKPGSATERAPGVGRANVGAKKGAKKGEKDSEFGVFDNVLNARVKSIVQDNKNKRMTPNKRAGKLHMNRLWRAKTGVQNVFRQQQERKGKEYHVRILVDQSGSMCDWFEKAHRMSLMAANSLKAAGCSVDIWGLYNTTGKKAFYKDTSIWPHADMWGHKLIEEMQAHDASRWRDTISPLQLACYKLAHFEDSERRLELLEKAMTLSDIELDKEVLKKVAEDHDLAHGLAYLLKHLHECGHPVGRISSAMSALVNLPETGDGTSIDHMLRSCPPAVFTRELLSSDNTSYDSEEVLEEMNETWEGSGNADYEALSYHYKDLNKKDGEKILIVITDGEPASHLGELRDPATIKSLVNVNKGVKTLALSIDSRHVEDIYSQYRIVEDEDEFKKALIQLIEQNVKRM